MEEITKKVRGWTKKLNKKEKAHLRENDIRTSYALATTIKFVLEHEHSCKECEMIAYKLGVV